MESRLKIRTAIRSSDRRRSVPAACLADEVADLYVAPGQFDPGARAPAAAPLSEAQRREKQIRGFAAAFRAARGGARPAPR